MISFCLNISLSRPETLLRHKELSENFHYQRIVNCQKSLRWILLLDFQCSNHFDLLRLGLLPSGQEIHQFWRLYAIPIAHFRIMIFLMIRNWIFHSCSFNSMPILAQMKNNWRAFYFITNALSVINL